MALRGPFLLRRSTEAAKTCVLLHMGHSRPKAALVIAAFTLFGCQPKSDTIYSKAESSEGGSPTNGAGDKNGDGSGSNEGPSKPTGPKKPFTDITIPEKMLSIPKPGTGGYSTSSHELGKLGEKIDAALDNQRQSWGEANTVFEVGGAKLMAKSDLKIMDSKRWKIEFFTSETKGSINRMYSDGNKRAMLFAEKWSTLPSSPQPTISSEKLLAMWPMEFTRLMFSKYQNGTPVWGKLFASLEDGTGGFSAKVESSTQKVVDSDRKIYRVLANSKDGSRQLEFVVDGDTFYPLTIRSIVKTGSGSVDKLLWTCVWKTGGHFQAKDFVIPQGSGPQ